VACRRTLVPARGLALELAAMSQSLRAAMPPAARDAAETAEAIEVREATHYMLYINVYAQHCHVCTTQYMY
jgi:hypothetical protein